MGDGKDAKGKGRKDPVAGRRGFFRLGAQRMRERLVEAVETLQTEADAATPQTPAPSPAQSLVESEDGRRYHRVRVRGPQPTADGAVAEPPVRSVIRPPGALPEAEFLATCSRCGECANACPEASIFKTGPQFGPHLEMTPMLVVENRACYLCTHVPCAAACPSGALVPLPADQIRIGTAVAFTELCLNTLGQPCTQCLDACPLPQKALLLTVDDEGDPVAGPKGSLPAPMIDESHCTGCGLCVLHCKAYPKALMVTPR